MNRLIVIGNGFDLAHNLKTSYYDFIFAYVKSCFLHAETHDHYKDEWCQIQKFHRVHMSLSVESVDNLDTFLEFLINSNSSYYSFLGSNEYKSPTKRFTWRIESKFIQHLIQICHGCKWVDIENEYYTALKKILDTSRPETKEKELEKLNDSFQFIIEKLETYLLGIIPLHLNPTYKTIFSELIQKSEIVQCNLKKNESPANTMILNFNYTTTIEHYFSDDELASFTDINYIHGKIGDAKKPIIFGFGDELDKSYEEIEAEKSKGFLKFIKSFGYFHNSNYHDLVRFIESDEYQVYIVGHSCGLSDRTMLNMIFEHNNCKSIKIWYHETENGNNYTELTQEISRHFRDKGRMRVKITPLNKSSPMPQVIRSEMVIVKKEKN